MSDRQLVKKLAKVMTEVKYIEKKGFNKFNNYKYATESDVAERVREVLAEQNVVMLPDVVEHTTREHTNRKGNIEYIATVKVKFTFIDGDTGEEISIHSAGEGQDTGDKAVYKAITGAQKYALMKAFMIPTGDDPEDDSKQKKDPENKPTNNKPQPITQKQVGEIKTKALQFAQARDRKDTEVYEALKIKDVTKLNVSQATAAIKQLDTWLSNVKQGA